MTLLKKTKVIMELSSINNMEFFGEFGAPEASNPSANDLLQGLNWDLTTSIPEGSFPSTNNFTPLNDEWTKPFQEFDEIQEVMGIESSSLGIETEFDTSKTQNLIDEVEEFLERHENSTPSMKIEEDVLPINTSSSSTSYMNDSGIVDDMKSTESILDALMTGNVIDTSSPAPSNHSVDEEEMLMEPVSSLPSSFIPPQQNPPTTTSTINLNDIMASGAANIVDCSKLTNVSEFVLEDGRNVIIMIAAPSKTSADVRSETQTTEPRSGFMGSNPVSPQASSVVTSDSDTEWLPPSESSSKVEKKRGSPRTAIPPPVALVKKGSGVNKRVKSTIQDKKERKKWQNVEAARRYRDKKKQEQCESEIEVKMLEDKNASLKDKLGQMENELTTLKKLMTELGLVKTSF